MAAILAAIFFVNVCSGERPHHKFYDFPQSYDETDTNRIFSSLKLLREMFWFELPHE